MATETALETWLDRAIRTVLFFTPLRHLVLYKYRYAFTPGQIRCLLNLADEALKANGGFVEVGCYRGYTTVFLNKHLDDVAPERAYLAVDTFGGFTADSVAHEVEHRGKSTKDRAFNKFTVNSETMFATTLKVNRISRVRILRNDICRAEFQPVEEFCFGLIDVDLYTPTVAALAKIWESLSPGGILVVDDCQKDHVYDGSRQALEEFCAARGVAFEILETKLGVIRKPLAHKTR
ncbi:MAG: TylF/MycF/NovP-related O-methyltransferase [Opitutaceae bacterium]|jgi:SAM-dependent methyltransferase